MPMPKFQEFLQPVLLHLKEKNECVSRKDLMNFVVDHFKPSQEDLNDILNNGQSRFVGNMNWAVVYLKHAELIEYVAKGVYQITNAGSDFLQNNPQCDLADLKEITALKEWLGKSKSIKNSLDNENTSEQEQNTVVISATEEYYESVEIDLLDRMKSMGAHSLDKGTKFEHICLQLLAKMGYGRADHSGGSGDRGVDGFLTTDHFGFDKIGIQCKCYAEGKINDDQITKFAHGLKNVNGLSKGIFITTTDYTPSALKVVEELKEIKIILINGRNLARYMREYQVGVCVTITNYVYDIVLGDDV